MIETKKKKQATPRKIFLFLFASLTLSIAAQNILGTVLTTDQQSENKNFTIEEIASGLGIPWGMAFLNPTEIMFTERNGGLGILAVETGAVSRLTGAPEVKAKGQGGLLDVAVPAGYQDGDWIYFTYSKDLGDSRAATTLARARRGKKRLLDLQDLLVTRSASSGGRHFGSRIAFDGAGHIFFTVGERGHRPNAQDLNTHAGSVLRVNLDGTVPDDNPFANKKDALPEIWSYGHRNPQGIWYDKTHERLWVMEHGPRGGDELNLVLPGRNYGWPVISYGREYATFLQVGEGTTKEGMEQPVKYYVPSISPGSLIIYSGKAFPDWRGNLFAGALSGRHLNRIVLDENGKAVGEERLLEELDERIRALVEGPDGSLYFSTDSGRIVRLKPVGH